jgi:putative ABC transport system permease protein
MWRNYFMATVRNMARNRLYSGIGIFGLAVGLCAALLTGLVIRSELTRDRFIPGYERTYVAAAALLPHGHPPVYMMESPSFFAGLLRLKFSDIGAVTRIAAEPVRLRHGEIEAREVLYWADPNAFELLPLPTLAGDLQTALRRPDAIVLNRSMARKYFGRDAPLGETLLLDGLHPATVTAVIEDLPINGTQFETGIFASGLAAYSNLVRCDRQVEQKGTKKGISLCGRTYLRVAPHARLSDLQRRVTALVASVYPPDIPGTLQLIRLDEVHRFAGLYPGNQSRLAVTGAIGALILLAACIVFINLSTARAARRALEVGVRKACGANRATLAVQFLGESLLYVALATVIAVSLAELSLPYVNAFLNTGAVFDYWRQPTILLWIVVGAVAVGILAGAYPAFVLSAFRPRDVLKGSTLRSGGTAARSALVVLQCSILIGLIIAAGVVYQQRIFATRDALRVDADRMLIIRSSCDAPFKNALRAVPGVRGVYCSSEAWLNGMTFCNCRLKDGTPLAVDMTGVEFGLFDLYGIKPVAGQIVAAGSSGDFLPEHRSRFVINETAVRRFGFASPAHAIGQVIPLADGPTQLAEFSAAPAGSTITGEIAAVVPDFSINAVEEKIRPTIYGGSSRRDELISVKLSGRDIPEILAAIDRLWPATGSKEPINRFFLDDYLQNLYLSVLREAQALGVFAVLGMLLASLGLLGLSAATAERRTKEIGIRKAMGAETSDILRMLLWQFTRPVLLASLLAWPLSGFILSRWLNGFAYHVTLQPWLFLAATLQALLITLVTVSGHAWHVARAKPVLALRYE